MSRSYQLLGSCSANISAVTPPYAFCNNFSRVAGLTEIFCNRGVVNKGKGARYSTSDITKRVLRPVACYSPVCNAAALQTISAIRLLPPQVCTYGFRCKVQTIRKGTIRAAPAVRCKPASTGSARRPSSTRRPAAPEGR